MARKSELTRKPRGQLSRQQSMQYTLNLNNKRSKRSHLPPSPSTSISSSTGL